MLEFRLVLNAYERFAISEIVVAMGEKNLAWLMLDSNRLTGLGNSIQHVPPLQFIGYIVHEPHLRENLRRIAKSMFKWPYMVDGFGANMERELAEGRLMLELPEFARFVGRDVERLEEYAKQHAWDEFVRALL